MIVFDLICNEKHRFEGWFASGEDFDAQKERGLLACPVCGGSHIEKLPTAKVRTGGGAEAPAPGAEARPMPLSGAPADLAQMLDYVLANTENVGGKFAEIARQIHYQEVAARSIRGTVTRTEADDLYEEGIPVFSLPVPPQDRWN